MVFGWWSDAVVNESKAKEYYGNGRGGAERDGRDRETLRCKRYGTSNSTFMEYLLYSERIARVLVVWYAKSTCPMAVCQSTGARRKGGKRGSGGRSKRSSTHPWSPLVIVLVKLQCSHHLQRGKRGPPTRRTHRRVPCPPPLRNAGRARMSVTGHFIETTWIIIETKV